jgi:endonuclease YncB( thermonuclease family)
MKASRRKRFAGILLAVAAALLVLPSVSTAGEFTVFRVTDGDTIKSKNTFGEMTIRLVGIDAPDLSHKKREPGQPFSQEAKKYLRALVLNKAITIREYGKDRYGRTLKSVDFALFTFRAVLKMKNTISRFQPIYSYNMNGPLSVKLHNCACSV